ncbi:hypothetical protein I302_100921 [Kwoniella bestiolae CBS 10118]|uniref:Uncharacterized protein n=1 Tax=Kwoniella bestiolae CBS 10118 TaxID=1296100 RepID=A0A1B9G6J2_9TREE|nr:hypothetical protein I302_04298 [Kwoniella bestiolae CBS 10118]OCF26612.1 hypothetical protein I302_04298 [Kwoniella bestiolae CBS 10118]
MTRTRTAATRKSTSSSSSKAREPTTKTANGITQLDLTKSSKDGSKPKEKTKEKVEKYIPDPSEFMDNSGPLKVQVGEQTVKSDVIRFEADKKIMSTGSFGWSGSKNGKVTLKNGKNVDVSISINVVVQNSSPSKRKATGSKSRTVKGKGKVVGSSSSSRDSD